MSLGPNGRPQTKRRQPWQNYCSTLWISKQKAKAVYSWDALHQLSRSLQPIVIKQPSLLHIIYNRLLIIFLSKPDKGSLSGHGQLDKNDHRAFWINRNLNVRLFSCSKTPMLTCWPLLNYWQGWNSSPPKSTAYTSQTINTNEDNLYMDRTVTIQAKLMQIHVSILHAGMW